jgi:adenine deaminase
MRELEHKLSVARGETPAELLFKNARLVNVFSGEIYPADVAWMMAVLLASATMMRATL